MCVHILLRQVHTTAFMCTRCGAPHYSISCLRMLFVIHYIVPTAHQCQDPQAEMPNDSSSKKSTSSSPESVQVTLQSTKDFADVIKLRAPWIIRVGPMSSKERVRVREDMAMGADIGGVHCGDGGWGHEPRNGGTSRG